MTAPARMLVVGASGLLGSHVVAAAQPRFEVLGVARAVEGLATEVVDLGDRASVSRVVERFRPDVVVICSAFSWVDGCEQDPARSLRENVGTVRTLCDALGGAPTRLVFYSTDHVFDGTQDVYTEGDAPNPLSVYARHKLDAEAVLLARGRALVLRTSYVFGRERRRKNFMYAAIDAASSGQPLRVPLGQAGMPTWAQWLAASTLTLLERGVEGIAHASGPELLTKAQWARVLVEGLRLGHVEVIETTAGEAGQVAPRPRRVLLSTRRHDLKHPPLLQALESERS